ncbi:MAG: dTDP-4-dehydrorhamnose reductase [Pyrinomonadaceae bacterium]
MKVLITGAGGMVGTASVKYCESIDDETIGARREMLDIADRASCLAFLRAHRPDAVINCAAYTNVDGAETNAEAARAANVAGVENLALACRESEARFLTISTDYVFDGVFSGFYTQRHTPNPISVYGRTKLDGEIAARNAYSRSIIVRSGWIFGEGGTNFLSVIPQLIGEGKAITAIDDAYGTPTFAGDLARRMRELIELDLPLTFHVANSGDGTTFAGFAERVCEIGGYDKSLVEPISKDSLERPAPRPVSSKLSCLLSERLGLDKMPLWSSSLKSSITRR